MLDLSLLIPEERGQKQKKDSSVYSRIKATKPGMEIHTIFRKYQGQTDLVPANDHGVSDQ